MKVLQVISSLGMGGAETWLMEVLRYWSNSGYGQMDFLMTSGKRQIFDDEAQKLGARLHYVRYGRTCLPRFAREFRSLLRKEQYQAIHDHQDYISGWHFLIGGSPLPSVRVAHVHNPAYQIRNVYGVTPSRRLTARIGKILVAHYATHITGTSRQIITEYGFDFPRFAHIQKAALHCGFDTTRFLGDVKCLKASVCCEFGWPDDVKIILFAGRIDESSNLGHPQNHKNSGFAVSVGIECARRDARARLLLAGAPSDAVPILEGRIAAAGFGERIKFIGIRKDIERLMIASDVLLFPSRGEGLGMVAVEAQAAGLPVLASTAVPRECVVVPDLVRFLDVEAGAIAWAQHLLELTEQSRKCANANRHVAESPFSIDKSANALFRLYSTGRLN